MNEKTALRREVLIVGNYAPDGQESMLRFARMLETGLRTQGVAVVAVAPSAWFGCLCPGSGGFGKWLAYLDKYLVFPWQLRRLVRRLGRGGVVHVADHSNAMYVRASRSAGHAVVVTCHDLGAVRGALGEGTDCPASRLGRVLQRWIARSLGEADLVACVSGATQRDVERLIRRPDGSKPRVAVALLGLNGPYGKIGEETARQRLRQVTAEGFAAEAPFVLNVGSGLSRKNRDGILRIFAQVKDRWPEGKLVFVGEALTDAERRLARELGVVERVASLVKLPDAALEALYNRATCLLFPSKFEGFGWPVMEAQACGCPVLCSEAGALAEVAAGTAFVRDFRDEAAFAAEIVRLARDEAARRRWTALGDRNVVRFGTDRMIADYRQLYDEVAAGSVLHPEAAAS